MKAIEFTTQLSEMPMLAIPREIALQLPKSGSARIIVLTEESSDESDWNAGAYQQFLREDSPEDAIYETLA